MGFPIALAAAVARKHVARADADDIDRRLRCVQADPAWIVDSYNPEIEALRRDRRERADAATFRFFTILMVIAIAVAAALFITIAGNPR